MKVTINSYNQVSCNQDGTVTVKYDDGFGFTEMTLGFASDEFRLMFISDVATAGQWAHQTEREQMERDLDVPRIESKVRTGW